ncbi:MAG: MmgE/PrpD family protein [Dehalococcoidia bacterium]|nr:MmgE/PrpD family protein [Dehalococcoidia bacterium]MDW8120555.1 MmgE/PrpD family protein [Chloroflexota bacterium]
MSVTATLVEWVTACRGEALPPAVRERVKGLFLDALACACIGSRQRWTQKVAQMVRGMGAQGPCTVVGYPWTTAPSLAALVNGCAVGGFELDHALGEASAHPSSAVGPAVLALGQALRASGERVVRALVLGYEAQCRIGLAVGRGVEDERGFHGPGTNGPLGAAVGAGVLLGLTPQQMAWALGNAGSHGAGLMAFAAEGAMTKRLHHGRSAQTGLECALLAQEGFTGPSQVLEGARGFFHAFSPTPRPQQVTEGLGTVWRLEGIFVKRYPCHASIQGVVEGLVRLRREGLRAEQVERVRVVGPPRLLHRHAEKTPRTLLAAQESLPFCVAWALLGNPEDPWSLTEALLTEPAYLGLAQRVEIEVDAQAFATPPLSFLGSEVTVETAFGVRRFCGWPFPGAPGHPLPWEGVVQKFRACAVPVLGEERTQAVVQKVAHLEAEGDISSLAGLLAGT